MGRIWGTAPLEGCGERHMFPTREVGTRGGFADEPHAGPVNCILLSKEHLMSNV